MPGTGGILGNAVQSAGGVESAKTAEQRPMPIPDDVKEEVKRYARRSPTRAVKALVNATGLGLADALDVVRQLAAGEVSDERLERLVALKTQ